MLNLKVGVMPGKLSEVVVENGTSARQIFEIAGIEIANHEIRLDGNKIDLDTKVNQGNLLVAMKMIKGNMPSIKVGLMPGKLTTVEYNQGDSARQIFKVADIEISNHEIRLDGNKIDIDSTINNGGLLVAMKQIKGNAEYVSECTEEEIEILLENKLPVKLDSEKVSELFDMVMIDEGTHNVILEKEAFDSVYKLEEEQAEENDVVEHVCKCNDERKRVVDILDIKIAELESDIEYYVRVKRDKEMKLQALLEVKQSL